MVIMVAMVSGHGGRGGRAEHVGQDGTGRELSQFLQCFPMDSLTLLVVPFECHFNFLQVGHPCIFTILLMEWVSGHRSQLKREKVFKASNWLRCCRPATSPHTWREEITKAAKERRKECQSGNKGNRRKEWFGIKRGQASVLLHDQRRESPVLANPKRNLKQQALPLTWSAPRGAKVQKYQNGILFCFYGCYTGIRIS